MTDLITEIYTKRKRTYHDYECEDIVIMKKQQWKKANFSGVIVDEEGNTTSYDKTLLNGSNDLVVQKFVEELISPLIKSKRKDGVQ